MGMITRTYDFKIRAGKTSMLVDLKLNLAYKNLEGLDSLSIFILNGFVIGLGGFLFYKLIVKLDKYNHILHIFEICLI